MTTWVGSILIAILSRLTSSLLSYLISKIHSQQDILESKNQIDARLLAFKEAYKEAFDGKPITPDQKAKLNAAISSFIRGDGNGGL